MISYDIQHLLLCIIRGNLGVTPPCPPRVVFQLTIINSDDFNKIINKNHLKRSGINEVTFFRWKRRFSNDFLATLLSIHLLYMYNVYTICISFGKKRHAII